MRIDEGVTQVDDPHEKTARDFPLPVVISNSNWGGVRETETVKNELLDELDQLGHLAERLHAAYEDLIPQSRETDSGEDELDAQLRADLRSSPDTAQQLVQFAREILHEYAPSLSPHELAEAQRHARHDIRNKIVPIHGVSQEVQLTVSADSTVAEIAAELQRGCEVATCLLDFLTGKTGREVPSAADEISLPKVSEDSNVIEPARILVADDNPGSADVLQRILARQGHDVVVVQDGQEAICTLAKHRDFDLVLLDVIMPVVDGLQVLSWIKNHSELHQVPVIMISGLDDDRRVVNCIAAGAEDYLSKPVNTVLLDARVGSCLRRRQAEKHRLQQYFSRELAKELACNSDDLLRTRNADVSILFCDIRRFSAISERVGAEMTIEWISSTMSTLSRIVFEHQGVLIDYTGDGLMAMWGAPQEDQHDHADLAVTAGLAMLKALGPLNAEWSPRLQEHIKLGVGINSGSAQVGVIGSSPKFKYGPLGSTVNLASRVEGTTKYLQSSLIVTQHTKRKLLKKKRYSVRRLCRASVVNMKRPVSLYEVQVFKPSVTTVFGAYQKALRLYEQREFRASVRLLGNLLGTDEGLTDVPSQLLLSRALSAMADQSSFNPVWEFGK